MGRTEHLMKNKELDKIAAIEQAIAKKFGKEAIQNPRANWDEKKEKEYLKQMKKFYMRIEKLERAQDKVDVSGIKVSKKLLSRESLKSCTVCGMLPKKPMDDVCFIKFDCCHNCYINFVEDREDRWLEGWRPDEARLKNV
jgi:hypothetical protein